MSSLDDHLVAVTDTRLAIVSDTAANLIAQLSELNELRERVRKAELSARRSQRIVGFGQLLILLIIFQRSGKPWPVLYRCYV